MGLNNLDVLVPIYFKNNKELKDLEKICKSENAQIKKIMADLVLSHYEVDDYKAVRSIQNRSKMDEDILLSIFLDSEELEDKVRNANIIKTKEYIDFDALEHAMYKGLFTEAELLELNKAVTTQEIIKLTVTKIKQKKKQEDD